MKKQLMPFIKTYAFIFISYLLISIIMAILLSFIQMSSFIYHLLIGIFSYAIIIVSAVLFFKLNKEKEVIHAIIFAILYACIISLAYLDHFSINLLLKPLLFILINIILYFLKKRQ